MSFSISPGKTWKSFLVGAAFMFVVVEVVQLYGSDTFLSLSFVVEKDRSLGTVQNDGYEPITNLEEEELINNEEERSPSLRKREDTSRSTALAELVGISKQVQCPANMYPVEQIQNTEADMAKVRKIPRIVHMTGKTRCLTKPFYDNMKRWSFEDHSFYFHDEEAVDKLFDQDWPMFPQLKNSIECLKNAGGAAKANLWRYLALWEYGGIYTDMDNAPGVYMNATTIAPGIDAFFVPQTEDGSLSQYFFAVSPHHPLMFYAVHDVMRLMHNLGNVNKFDVPERTGSGTIKRAFLSLMGLDNTRDKEEKQRIVEKYGNPGAGQYRAKISGRHSVTVVGNQNNTALWCLPSNVVGLEKEEQWKAMNIIDFRTVNEDETQSKVSCLMTLYNKHEKEMFSGDQLIKRWEQFR